MAAPATPEGPAARSRGAAALGGIGEAFADANFRRYSLGSIVSWLSFYVQAVAVSWVAWSLTHSTGWLAAVALLDAVPMGALAPLGGVVADRHDRFRVLMTAYAFATAQSAILAGLAFSGRLTIEWLAVLAFAHGVIHAFSVPSAFGLLPRFVARSRLSSAIGVAAAYTQLGLFVGPALAGWVLLKFGPAAAFASNVAGYGVFFACAARLRTPPDYESPPARAKPLAHDLIDGVRAIAAHPGVRGLLTLMLFGDALSAAVLRMAPAFADRALHAGVEAYSTLLASGGVGAILSALWLAHGGARRSRTGVILAAFLGQAAATALLMSVATLPLAAIAMAMRGLSFEICRTGAITLLQTSVPDGLRGRVMSAQFFLQQIASALGVAMAGAAADRWGVRLPLLCGSAIAALALIPAARARKRLEASFGRQV